MSTHRCLRVLSVVVLIVGLGSAIYLYLTAGPVTGDPFNPMTSKAYIRELQMYGGKFNVLAAELSQWFESLWHGRALACIVGGISFFLAGLLWFINVSRQIDHGDDDQ